MAWLAASFLAGSTGATSFGRSTILGAAFFSCLTMSFLSTSSDPFILPIMISTLPVSGS